MGRLIIPHADPDPPVLDTPLPVNFPKKAAFTWTDFHPESGRARIHPPQSDDASLPQWQRIADEIENLRARFIKQNPKAFNATCSNIDRSVVIAVYNEALSKLEHAANIDAIKIHLEVKTKVSTILDLRRAAPDDAVFYTQGAFLSPLEPHYAQPRLDYFNRGISDGDDSYYWTGIRRLREWRKGGWPKVYPEKAVRREMREREERRRRGMGTIAVHREDLLTALAADSLDWGEEVDANPGRPWR
ncbi:hypothetical protein E8E12_008712 [Didymella heteroderae]|uniref:Uncharacterized protein n=1 Tax=Didymella heteroderae TaxID=1769908 RepID=A0A9P4WR98_9PLEO|nr:hypothetical protein E8E12_008712 [Didymella heteroderae]